MAIELKKQSYEKLIKQLIFLEENSGDITEALLKDQLFASEIEIQKFLREYANKVESVIAHVVIVNGAGDLSVIHQNLFPFVVIDSCFTLKDRSNNNYYCRLTPIPHENAVGISHNIYAFSLSGLRLLLREKNDLCSVDLGGGYEEYLVNSIRLY